MKSNLSDSDEEKMESMDDLEIKVDKGIFSKYGNRVKLNVGGTIFETSFTTLLKEKSTIFNAIFQGKFGVGVDDENGYFFDRDPRLFRHILNFLRDGRVYLNNTHIPDEDIEELLLEAHYYQVAPLIRYLSKRRSHKMRAKNSEWSNEKEYKLITGVKENELEEIFTDYTVYQGYDFENWVRGSSQKIHVLFSKKLSKGEVALLDQLLSG